MQKPVAQMPEGIILAEYIPKEKTAQSYQSERELEDWVVNQLVKQGYELVNFKHNNDFEPNIKKQIERLNNVKFTDYEWKRFVSEYLDSKSDSIDDKIRKFQENYIYDFTFDDESLKNIKIIDKERPSNNKVQVVRQVENSGTHLNRYDVSILINGLPLVHIELKRRGESLKEAFNQIHRYSKESFNSDNSWYKYVQIFVISNGTNTKYFANTTKRDSANFEFTCNWADAKNRVINDIEDFVATFFEKRVILEVLSKHCVFNAQNELLILRPYQIVAVEKILRKINTSYLNKKFGTIESGGYIWHATGSGKTLTSFKASRLATKLDYIDKVFFVVDRKDLDYQTILEYEKFQKNSVNGSKDTKELKKNIEAKNDRIVVTTIQKLNEFIKKNPKHEIYNKHCVLIFDECHRSQFGEAQNNIKKYFKKYYQFGFTGTPIFEKNKNGLLTTAQVFGKNLHSYVITDTIRDEKVLKFKVDYHNVGIKYKDSEHIIDEVGLKKADAQLLKNQDRISLIVRHILEVFDFKTHRNIHLNLQEKREQGFNAMFAVGSIEMARLYYNTFMQEMSNLEPEKRLRVATIFSFGINQDQAASGEITEENLDTSSMQISDREFLDKVICDYNSHFLTNFSTDSKGFEGYYQDISKRVKDKEIDILIVVGMFLTGFDSKHLNTLFVDKNLCFHGLIQAYSRTNRILNSVKNFGNIVCFRNLQNATIEAIKLFGDSQNTSDDNQIKIVLERSYDEYMNGYYDEDRYFQGYKELCAEILKDFPDPLNISDDEVKKEFVKKFGELLKCENILKNYDEFHKEEKPISQRQMQDYKSVYVDIREEVQKLKEAKKEIGLNSGELEFFIELLRTDEINLDYILGLIFEKTRDFDDIEILKADVKNIIRSSLGIRAKEELIMRFINQANYKEPQTHADLIEDFYKFAIVIKEESIDTFVKNENLVDKKIDPKKFINDAIKVGYVDPYGEGLSSILPPTSYKDGAREKKKKSVLEGIRRLVEIFVGI